MITDDFFYFDELEIYKSIYTKACNKKFMSLRDVFYSIDTPFVMESHVTNWHNEKVGKYRKRKTKSSRKEGPQFLEKNSSLVQSVFQKFLRICCVKSDLCVGMLDIELIKVIRKPEIL
jgi:hypothetical protein